MHGSLKLAIENYSKKIIEQKRKKNPTKKKNMTNKKICNKFKGEKWKFTLQNEFQEVPKAIIKTPNLKWVWCSKIEIVKNYS